MKQASILIVDDDALNFDLIKMMLRDENYLFHYAASGHEAMEILSSITPNLILLDMMMPGINGIETCRQIKSMPEWRAIPIIMVTSLSSTDYLNQCIAAGAEDFIRKPINLFDLNTRVQAMLRIKEQYGNLK